jgi:mannose-6-phosphate isomerase-like protein (cupin superfamily)
MLVFDNAVKVPPLPRLVLGLLPHQGCIELQRDASAKEHAWHSHQTDETLIILDGALTIFWGDRQQLCGPGAVIRLPAGTRHKSIASQLGATYVIVFRMIPIAELETT